MFAATVIAVPIFLMRVSEDHFVRPRAKHSLPVHFVRVVLGLALIVLGVAMVVLPGQGLLTILVGVSVIDLPIKDRIVARILRIRQVGSAITSLRRRAGKPPLILPAPQPLLVV